MLYENSGGEVWKLFWLPDGSLQVYSVGNSFLLRRFNLLSMLLINSDKSCFLLICLPLLRFE